jgi:hypothetical protein
VFSFPSLRPIQAEKKLRAENAADDDVGAGLPDGMFSNQKS